MFPVEIIEIFFQHSRGIDIVNFRRVCKTWKNIIDRLTKDTNLWRIKCDDEIPADFSRSISNKLYPNISWIDLYQSANNSRWLRIYQSWIKWQRIKDTKIHVAQFEPFFIRLPTVEVTCVTASGNLLAVGSSEGFIAFYDVDSSTEEPIFVADQKQYVSNVQFFRDDDRIVALSSSALNHVMFWDVRFKKAIGEQLYGRLISSAQRRIWIAMRYKLKILSKNIKKIYEFGELHGTIVALVADGEQALVWTDFGYSYRINLNNTSVECVEAYVEPPAKQVCKYYLFLPWIAVCITEDGFLGISVNNARWTLYEILSKLHGVPTCVLFYANVLVLGLDSGSVHIYYVDNVESLDSLDLQSENSKLIVVDNQTIVALDIMDCPDKQYLIAATAEKVSVIEIRHFD